MRTSARVMGFSANDVAATGSCDDILGIARPSKHVVIPPIIFNSYTSGRLYLAGAVIGSNYGRP